MRVSVAIVASFAMLLGADVRFAVAARGVTVQVAKPAGSGPPITAYASSSGAGNACTIGSPCALDTAHSQVANRSGSVVNLLGDVTTPYRRTSALALTSADKGVTYQNAAGATPYVIGSVQVTGWTTYSGSIQVATVPSSAHVAAREIWVNGNRTQRAASALSGLTANGTGFSGTNGISGWADAVGAEVVGYKQWRIFRCPITGVTSSQVTLANPCYQSGNGAEMGGQAFTVANYVENALEALTQAGEWYLDTTAWKLYYWPRPMDGTFSAADVEMPIVESLVTVSGANNSTIKGVHFDYATWLHPNTPDGFVPVQSSYHFELLGSNANCNVTSTADSTSNSCMVNALGNVSVDHATNVTIQGNTFEHLGGIGLVLGRGTQGSTVTQNVIHDTGASGLSVGDVSNITDGTASGVDFVTGNTLTQNFIYDIANEHTSGAAAQFGWTTNTNFTNNEIISSPYSGIMEGGFNNVNVPTTEPSYASNTYSKNQVHYTMNFHNDGGPLYTIGAMASGSGSAFTNNVVSNQGCQYASIYFDNWSSYKSATGNVIEIDDGVSTFALVQNGSPGTALNNTVSGNYSNSNGYNGPCATPNTCAIPTAVTGIFDGTVASILNASGTTLRTPEIAHGKTATASSTNASPPSGVTTSAAAAVNGSGRNGYRWDCAAGDAAPYWQVDLGADYNIDTVEIVGLFSPLVSVNYINPNSYVVKASDDATFATGVTTLGTRDSSEFIELPQYVQFYFVSPVVRARYVRIASTAGPCAVVSTNYGTLGFNQVRVHGQ